MAQLVLSIFWVDWMAVFCGGQVEQGTRHIRGRTGNCSLVGTFIAYYSQKGGVHMRRKQLGQNREIGEKLEQNLTDGL